MTDTAEQVCPFGDDCDLTIAYMSGFGRGKYLADRQTQEAVAAALMQAKSVVGALYKNTHGVGYEEGFDDAIDHAEQAIEALIPADALAALEARDARVRDAERERCAKVADDHTPDHPLWQRTIGRTIAAAIREGK